MRGVRQSSGSVKKKSDMITEYATQFTHKSGLRVANFSSTFLPPHDCAHKLSLIKGCIPVERCRGNSSNERRALHAAERKRCRGCSSNEHQAWHAVTGSGRKRVARLNPIYMQKVDLRVTILLPQHGLKETRKKSPPVCRHNVYVMSGSFFSPLAWDENKK